jgi:hypothetical protein
MVIAARSGWKYIQTIGYGAHYVAEWDGYKVDFWTSSKHVSTFASSKHVSDENYVAWRIQAPNARMSRAESLKEATENAKRAIERRLGMKPHEVIQAILVS